MRFFNTAGPVNPQDHYCLPPLTRVNLDEVLSLIAQKTYFILHAPLDLKFPVHLLRIYTY